VLLLSGAALIPAVCDAYATSVENKCCWPLWVRQRLLLFLQIMQMHSLNSVSVACNSEYACGITTSCRFQAYEIKQGLSPLDLFC
jgi:hypothetical protein